MSGNNFNQHFASVVRDITDQLQREMLQSGFNTVFDEIYCANSLFLELINEQEISEIILELKRDSTSGFDEILVKDFIDFVSKELDKKNIVVAVFVDLRKAFDVVSFDILLKKLEKMGFKEKINELLKTYLYHREQYVSIDGVCSSRLSNAGGIPQGSVLGPLLYSIYVLNLQCAGLTARYFTFADDTVLAYTGTNGIDMQDDINSDLKSYLNWLYSNKLKINIDKTKYMVFKQKNKIVNKFEININNIILSEVLEMKYLGLTIDHDLSWGAHINKIAGRIIPMIPVIFKCKNYLTDKTKKKVYNAFFLSHFRYLIPVWGMCNKTNFNTSVTK